MSRRSFPEIEIFFLPCWNFSRKTINNNYGEKMELIADIAVALVALVHLYILALEMFLWEKPAGRRAFRLTPEFAKASRVLAANQGLYNGFLSAGLAWGLVLGAGGVHVKVFFLGCVIVAGVFGAMTASRKIIYVQALPAAIALALVMVSRT
jgi:putative membrane protein